MLVGLQYSVKAVLRKGLKWLEELDRQVLWELSGLAVGLWP